MTSFSELLALEELGPDQFLASSPGEVAGRLFGGQLAAQALRAGCLTAPADRRPHSLHAYFLRPGRADLPIQLTVTRNRDGRSFSTRVITASQGDDVILMMMASFHAGEDGPDWQAVPRPAVPEPEEVPPVALSWFSVWENFDIRPVRPDALHPCWIRLKEPLPGDSSLHACALAFVSDLGVVYSARIPGAAHRPISGASLDHALWLHRPVSGNEWLLFSVGPASNSSARGLATGTLHTAGGALAASLTQEAILRPITAGDSGSAAACAGEAAPEALRAELAALPLPALLRYWHRLTWWTGVWPLFRHLTGLDLTLPEIMMLRLLGRRTLNVAEVAESIALSQSAASRAVDRLVRAGLISRQEDPQDRRNKRLGLTGTGLARIQEVERVFGAELGDLITDLPAADQEALAALFAQLLAAFLARHQGEEYTDWAREVGAWSTAHATAAPSRPAGSGRRR